MVLAATLATNNGIQALWQRVYAASARLLPPASRTTLLLPPPEPRPAQAQGLNHRRPGAIKPRSPMTPVIARPWLAGHFASLQVVLPQLPSGMQIAPLATSRNVRIPAWMTVFVTMMVLLGVGGWIRASSSGPAAKPAARPTVAPRQSVPLPLPAAADPPYALAQFVEVTGLRVVVDLNHRSQVQYLVVNHSAIPLTGLGLQVAVRSALAASNSEPLFTVSARVPSLGPHQSKEIRTDLDTQLRASAIPDWENLRTDVQVSFQP